MPTLVAIDDNDEEIPSLPMQPRMINVRDHAPYRYDNVRTVKEDSMLLFFSDRMWHVEGKWTFEMEASK